MKESMQFEARPDDAAGNSAEKGPKVFNIKDEKLPARAGGAAVNTFLPEGDYVVVNKDFGDQVLVYPKSVDSNPENIHNTYTRGYMIKKSDLEKISQPK